VSAGGAAHPLPPSAGTEGGGAERERALQREGRDFLFSFFAAARALKLYPLENQTVQNAVVELDLAARRLFEREAGIELRYVGEQCFLNDLRLRIDLGNYATFGGVGRLLERHGVGELAAAPTASRGDWIAVLSQLALEPDPSDPFGWLADRLHRAGITHIGLRPALEAETLVEDDRRATEAAKRTYAYSVAVAREVMGGARIGRGVSVRRVKRAVQSMVDHILNHESSIVGMTVLRDYDEYTFAHSVNVCIFSVALGKKLGLSKTDLYELGLGALLHDIGKVRMPVDVINKTSGLNDEEWALLREHPTEGLLTLFEMRDLSYLPLRAMLIAYEHHMKVDLTGYPRSYRPRRSHLFARIVAIADAFDAATSKRSYQSQPWTPDMVLRELRDNPARGHDPLLVRAFIGMTGIYPVGSLLVLDSYELAIAVAANPDPKHAHQPVVRVVFDSMGLPIEPPVQLDLSQVDPATGAPFRTIIKSVDPERYGIDVARYFV
jgi:HD-GYP domain-containing protein (c-di-GMP phosphodiesterase class II)